MKKAFDLSIENAIIMIASYMKNVLIRDVDDVVLDKIKSWARRRNRSLQSELKMIIDSAAERREPLSDLELIRKIRATVKIPQKTNSVELLREDRNR